VAEDSGGGASGGFWFSFRFGIVGKLGMTVGVLVAVVILFRIIFRISFLFFLPYCYHGLVVSGVGYCTVRGAGVADLGGHRCARDYFFVYYLFTHFPS
jgi:hypothetical protein